MKERRHKCEQYFFDAETVGCLAELAAEYASPCCLCAPTIGAELERRGMACTVLDQDTRWNALRGFQRYDIQRPERLGERFGLIVVDPPFFAVALAELFRAVRYLSQGDEHQPLLFCHLVRFGPVIVERFARFGVEPIAYYPGYQSVPNNGIQLFGNLGPARHGWLAARNRRRLTDTPQKR